MDTSREKQTVVSASDVRELLRGREARIREERRTLLTMLIGLSGSAVILSMTFLKDIAPQRVHIWLVIVSWVFFAAASLVGVGALVLMTMMSVAHQRMLEAEVREGFISVESERYNLYDVGSSRTVISFIFVDLIAAALFLLGLIFLGLFAVINLA